MPDGSQWRSVILAGVCAAALFVSAAFPVRADEYLPRTDPKVKRTEEVFRSLVRAIGDNRTPPELRMTRGKSSTFDIAVFVPKRHVILVEERFFDLAESLAPDALALIIGHELAHYYRNHQWAIEFGNAFADRQRDGRPASEAEPGKSGSASRAEERRRVEAEADYYAGFYSFLAGYRPFRVSDQLFDAIYRDYKFDPALPAYEHLTYRKAAAQQAQSRLQRLLPLFEAGLYLSLIKDHQNAARVFDRLSADFPGPEMLNNAGVSLVNEALRWFDAGTQPYVYPLELDSDTRLRGDGGRGGREFTEEEKAERRRLLLEQSQDRFERAARAAPSYAAALVNWACALDLLGESESAWAKARQVLEMVGRTGQVQSEAQAHVVAGIAAARLGRREEARASWVQAKAMGSRLAEENLAADSVSSERNRPVARELSGNRQPLQPERVGGVTLSDLRLGDLMAMKDHRTLGRWGADEDQPELQILHATMGAAGLTAFVRGAAPSKRSIAIFLSAEMNLQGTSLRGLAEGDPLEKVERLYGAPSSIVMMRQGIYQVFENRYRDAVVGLILCIDGERRVKNWVAYRLEE